MYVCMILSTAVTVSCICIHTPGTRPWGLKAIESAAALAVFYRLGPSRTTELKLFGGLKMGWSV